MKKHAHAEHNNLDTLAEDARALLAATADVAEEKVVAARKRVAAALDDGREFFNVLRVKSVAGAQIANQTVRTHPYEAIGVAFGLGALVGCLLARRRY